MTIHSSNHISTLEAEFSAQLSTKVLGRQTQFLDVTTSTNTLALDWANENAPEGALVLAEYQNAGRGRHGRTWESIPSSNLLFSLVLRPNLPPSSLSLITVAASVALTDTIDAFIAPTISEIKWPNDILISKKKCSGMLLESAISASPGSEKAQVVLGIGVNVNQHQFDGGIATSSTSLLLEAGRHIPRMAFLADFLLRLEAIYLRLHPSENEPLLLRYRDKLAFMHEPTTLHFIGSTNTIHGTVKGISKTGALRLATVDGIREFHAGEVTSRIQTEEM